MTWKKILLVGIAATAYSALAQPTNSADRLREFKRRAGTFNSVITLPHFELNTNEVRVSVKQTIATGNAALGKQFRSLPSGPLYTVIGVVGGVRDTALAAAPARAIYFPEVAEKDTLFSQTNRTLALVLRTAGDPAAITNAARAVIRELDPTLPVFDVRPMRSVLEASTAQRFNSVYYLDPSKVYLWQGLWTSNSFRLVVKEGVTAGSVVYDVAVQSASGNWNAAKMFAFLGTNNGSFVQFDGTYAGMTLRNLWVGSTPRPTSLGSAIAQRR